MIEAVLSFSLPGLGQLHQGRFLISILFFIFFVFLSFKAWFWMPLLAVGAAWEAFRISSPKSQRATIGRNILYGIVGAVGLVAWSGGGISKMAGLPDQVKFNSQADRIADTMRICRAKLGRSPTKVDECQGLAELVGTGEIRFEPENFQILFTSSSNRLYTYTFRY